MDDNTTRGAQDASSGNEDKKQRIKKESRAKNSAVKNKKAASGSKNYRNKKPKKAPSTSEPVLNDNVVPLTTAVELQQSQSEPQKQTVPPETSPEASIIESLPSQSEPPDQTVYPESSIAKTSSFPSEPFKEEISSEPAMTESAQSKSEFIGQTDFSETINPEPQQSQSESLSIQESQQEPKSEFQPAVEYEPSAQPSYNESVSSPDKKMPSEEDRLLPEERFSDFTDNTDEKNTLDRDFANEAKHMFISAGFTPKKIAGCLIAILIIFGMIFIFFHGGKDFAINLWNKIFTSNTIETPREGTTKTQEQKITVSYQDIAKNSIDLAYKIGGSYFSTFNGILTSSLQTAYLVGLQQPKKLDINTGLDAAFAVGFKKPILDDNVFKKYVRVYAELRNAYNTDIYEILNKSTNRAAELDIQLAMLEDVYKRAQDQFNLINAEMAALKENFKTMQNSKSEAEKSFFEDLKNGLPEKSYIKLMDYIAQLQKQDEIKSRHNAISILSDYYKILLNKMNLRIEDIKKNKDVLIQGVRVYEVPGSNVDVIIKGNSKADSSYNLESTKGFSIIPPDASFVSPQINNIQPDNNSFNTPPVHFK